MWRPQGIHGVTLEYTQGFLKAEVDLSTPLQLKQDEIERPNLAARVTFFYYTFDDVRIQEDMRPRHCFRPPWKTPTMHSTFFRPTRQAPKDIFSGSFPEVFFLKYRSSPLTQ